MSKDQKIYQLMLVQLIKNETVSLKVASSIFFVDMSTLLVDDM